jgi:murein DD-endopeptidase MepM/ murein hydrolase activator NlpD
MREYITIIIAHHEGKAPKTIRIRKRYIKAFGVFAMIFILFSVFSYSMSLKFLSEKQHLIAEGHRLTQEIKSVALERQELKKEKALLTSKLKNLEEKLLLVEDYLSKRGLVKNSLAVGGARRAKEASYDPSYLQFLEDRADYLLSTLKGIPLGYPLYGRITSSMGWRKNPFGRGYEFHSGIDIEAPMGRKVFATAEGVVEFAGWYADYGKAVIIRHPSGYITLYGHLSQIDVKEGQKVKAGEVVGRVGSTGRSTGPHLHYEVIKGNKPIDPVKFLAWE